MRRHWRRSCVFIVNFEHISHLGPVFLLLNLNMPLPAGKYSHHAVFNLTPWWRRSLSYRNQSIDCRANQCTVFYTIGISVMKELMKWNEINWWWYFSDSFEDIHKAYLFCLNLKSSNFQARILTSDLWWNWEDKPTIG